MFGLAGERAVFGQTIIAKEEAENSIKYGSAFTIFMLSETTQALALPVASQS